jgi:hypothetical protein
MAERDRATRIATVICLACRMRLAPATPHPRVLCVTRQSLRWLGKSSVVRRLVDRATDAGPREATDSHGADSLRGSRSSAERGEPDA